MRDALRSLRQSLPVTLTIVACLSFGMGSVTLVYSWYEGLIERPLPAVPRMDALISIRPRATAGPSFASLPEYRDWRDQAASVTGISASTFSLFGVSLDQDAATGSEPIYGIYASANYFRVLGLEIPVGSDFQEQDDSPNRERLAIIISDRLWRGRLGQRSDVIGHTVRINGVPGTIIGVAPPWFGGTLAGASFDLWVTLAARASLVPSEAALIESRSHRWLDVITAQRRPGVTMAQASEEFASIGERLSRIHEESRERPIDVVPLDTGSMQQLRPLFTSMLALTAVVLLIVCSNVANLLLVRGAWRARMIAIRLALGATRAQVIGAMMIENGLLAIAGAFFGVAITIAGNRVLLRTAPTTTIPLNLETRLDWRVLVFIVVLTTLTVLVFGILPALFTTRLNIIDALGGHARGNTSGKSRLRSALVAVQFALCLTTLISGTLFLRRAQTLAAIDPGFADPARVLLLQSESALAGYRDLNRWQSTLDAIAGRVRAIPGVTSAAWSSFIPLGFVGYTWRDIAVDGYSPKIGESMRVLVSAVGDGYFDVMGIPILEGRPIGAEDSRGRPPVAVVNEAFVRRFWSGASGVGRTLTMGDRSLTVIGVAKDGRHDYRALDAPPEPFIYYAMQQAPARYAALHVRTGAAALTAVPAVRRAILDIDPSFTTLAPLSLEEYIAGPMMPLRMGLTLLGVLAVASLFLSAMGLQAIVAYGVTVRTREIGIRLTLGASPVAVAGIFLRQAIVMTAAGVAAGLAGAAAIVPLLQQRVGYLGPMEGVSIAWPVALLSMVGISAGYLTAWRATRVDPAQTLRSE